SVAGGRQLSKHLRGECKPSNRAESTQGSHSKVRIRFQPRRCLTAYSECESAPADSSAERAPRLCIHVPGSSIRSNKRSSMGREFLLGRVPGPTHEEEH